jgi:5-methylcytosine-specific restriction endonuclease McrA
MQAAHNATRKASWKVGSRQDRVSRAAIIERDGSMCHICGKKCEASEIHLDHVVPLAKGGTHDAENLRVACAKCNLEKGARTVDVSVKRTRLRGDQR